MKYFFAVLLSFLYSNAHGQVIDTLVLVHEHSVLFGSDKWELTEVELIKLDTLASLSLESDQLVLEGHTDKVGSENYNYKLSSKRLESVVSKLLQIGVAAAKIKSNVYGELQPLIDGEDESAFRLNRRVSIKYFKFERRRIVKGSVEEEITQTPLKARIKISGKDFVDSTFTRSDGSFSFAAPDNKLYKLEISADNHFFNQRFIKVSPEDSSIIQFSLPELSVGRMYTLPNFNFKGNLPILLERSIPTLDLLYELMLTSNVCIEIKGHINLPNEPDCEKDTRHYKLSVDRSQMVYDNMISKGIDSDRMLPRGYGNWEMLYPKATNEKYMEKNRRVEIKIIDCASKELTLKNLK